MIPLGGWPILAIGVVMIATVLIGGAHLERRRRPELWVFFSTVINIQVLDTRRRGAVRGAAHTAGLHPRRSCRDGRHALRSPRIDHRRALLVLAATFGVDPGYVAAHPQSVVVPLALVVSVALYLDPLLSSDVRYRSDSTLDGLTRCEDGVALFVSKRGRVRQ